jgi:hypothetical protein
MVDVAAIVRLQGLAQEGRQLAMPHESESMR